MQSNFESAKKRALTACFCRSKMHIAKVCWFPRIDKSRSRDNRMELPDGWSLKKSRLGQKAFIHAETNTKIFEVPDENTIFELAKARPKKYGLGELVGFFVSALETVPRLQPPR